MPKKGMDMIPEDYRKISIISMPLMGGGIRRKLIFSGFILPALFHALLVMLIEKPQVVVGTGGYASFFPILIARILGIPALIQEQNVMPGLATRILARIVNRVFISFRETSRWLPGKNLLVTGNPLRERIGQITRIEGLKRFGLAPEFPTVLILGGSRGAHSINKAFLELLGLLPSSTRIQFIVLTGGEDLDRVKKKAASKSFKTVVFDFLPQIEYAYAASDLVISRAGATTISELLACAKPSILIPYPYAGKHQQLNASVLEENGVAVVIEDRILSGKILKEIIFELIYDKPRLQQMSENAKSLKKIDAAKLVAEEIKKCSGI